LISCYPIPEAAFEEFQKTGNIGVTPEERVVRKNEAQLEREASNARSFYRNLPKDARIGNKQLREVEALQEKLKENPNFPLSEKQKNMLQRADKYQQYKNKFYQNNPDTSGDEL
jgi:hypothetical protein